MYDKTDGTATIGSWRLKCETSEARYINVNATVPSAYVSAGRREKRKKEIYELVLPPSSLLLLFLRGNESAIEKSLSPMRLCKLITSRDGIYT